MLLTDYLKNRNPRTKRYIVGASSNVLSQVVVAISSLVITGILARYFTPEEFGIWAILSVFLGMFISFDLGFGNALKNHISELFAQRTPESDGNARVMYFSMFYTMLFWFGLVSVVFFLFRHYIPWNVILKTKNHSLQVEGQNLLLLVVIFFAISSAFQVYSHGFYGYQETQFISLVNASSRFTFLFLVVIAVTIHVSFFDVNIIYLGDILGFSIIGFFFFAHRRGWKTYSVSLSDIRSAISKLYSSSLQFTALQIIAVIASNLDMFVVSNRLGLTVVGDYALVKRIYLFSMSFHGMALLPLWPAFTEAVVKKDYQWVRKLLEKAVVITVVVFAFQIVSLFFIGDWVIRIWSGKVVQLSWTFLTLGVFYLMYALGNVFSVFLNSINMLKWQILVALVGLVAFFPLAGWLVPIYGVQGVALTLVLISFPTLIYLSLHTRKIIGALAFAEQPDADLAASDK